MSANNTLPENVKLVRFLDALMFRFGGSEGINQKLVMKDLSQKEKHLTMMVLNNKTLNVHETTEGTKKSYNQIASLDLSIFQEIQPPNTSIEELMTKSGVQELDPNSPEYDTLTVFAPNEGFGNVTIKKNEALITKESTLPVCKLTQIKDFGYTYATVSDGLEFRFIVMKIHGKYYKFTLEAMGKMLFLILPESTKNELAKLGLSESALLEELRK